MSRPPRHSIHGFTQIGTGLFFYRSQFERVCFLQKVTKVTKFKTGLSRGCETVTMTPPAAAVGQPVKLRCRMNRSHATEDFAPVHPAY